MPAAVLLNYLKDKGSLNPFYSPNISTLGEPHLAVILQALWLDGAWAEYKTGPSYTWSLVRFRMRSGWFCWMRANWTPSPFHRSSFEVSHITFYCHYSAPKSQTDVKVLVGEGAQTVSHGGVSGVSEQQVPVDIYSRSLWKAQQYPTSLTCQGLPCHTQYHSCPPGGHMWWPHGTAAVSSDRSQAIDCWAPPLPGASSGTSQFIRWKGRYGTQHVNWQILSGAGVRKILRKSTNPMGGPDFDD